MNFTIEQLRNAWLAAALAEWSRGVFDFERGQRATPERIFSYFERNGWSSWNGGRYTENSKTSWCGHFAGATGQMLAPHLVDYAAQPIGLEPEISRFCMPSTGRLDNRLKWQAAGARPAMFWESYGEHVGRNDGAQADNWQAVLKPGMIATIATSGKKPRLGDHIVIVIEATPAGVHTVEGNGRGFGPNGEWIEGVIVRDERKPRPYSALRRAYEFEPHHFEAWL